MKLKKLLIISLASVLSLSVIGCTSSKEDNKIIVGASSTPHAEILEVIKPQLEKEGYQLEIKIFDDYVTPNTALEEGSIDANYFQHIPYLEETIESTGYNLTSVAKIHLEPMGLYSNKIKSVEEVSEGATIAIPNDPSNGARALKLLVKLGLIEVKEGDLIGAKDITKNPKNIKIKELDAAQLPAILDDVESAIINTNYALSANLNPTKDSIAIESKDSPYSNILAVKEENKDGEKTKVLSKALISSEVKEFIETEYKGSIIPSF